MSMGITGVWDNMIETYKKMGLSDEEITKRILCKATKVTDACEHDSKVKASDLGKCDEKEQQQ